MRIWVLPPAVLHGSTRDPAHTTGESRQATHIGPSQARRALLAGKGVGSI